MSAQKLLAFSLYVHYDICAIASTAFSCTMQIGMQRSPVVLFLPYDTNSECTNH